LIHPLYSPFMSIVFSVMSQRYSYKVGWLESWGL
jgi:hypothetical protein